MMFKKGFILITVTGVSILFANQPETVRESTIIYKLKEGATAAELKSFNALVNRNTIIEEKEIKGLRVKVVKVKNIKGLEKAFSKKLMNTGAVKFAEPDALIPHAVMPNDTSYSSQWHHTTINSPLAWDQTTGPDGLDTVKVCVLDTGVETLHPDLVGNLLLPGYNAYLEQDGNVEDKWGHGTATIGLIGAVGNNNAGVTGMAWYINVIPVRIDMGTSSSAYISDMAVGITWCADQGGKVANLSYGGAQYSTIDTAAQYLRDSGGLLFMSAGNDGTYNSIETYPDYASFIIVGATTSSDVKSSFSEYGPFVDVVAPGSSVYTTKIGGYAYWSGTSFSSPITAGLAALIYSVNPNFTPAEVESYIFSTAVDLGAVGDDDMYGHGRIDAGAAVVAAMDGFGTPNILPVAAATVDKTSGPAPLTVAFNGSASTDEDGTITSYSWDFGDGNTANGVTATHTYQMEGNFNATLTVTDNRAAQATSAPIAIEVTPNLSSINTPTNLTAAVDGNSVSLNWNDNSSNETGFDIYRAQKIRGKYNYSLIGTSTSNTYPDTNIDVGDYRYKIQAKGDYNGGDIYSDFSNEVSVKVETSLPVEPDPGTLSAPVLSTSVSGSNVTLTWSHDCPEGSTCTYYGERGDAKVRGQINFSQIASVSTLSYDVMENAGTYYYRVTATTDSGDSSDYSNTMTVRLK
jgi:PKD repeat protein